MDKRNNIILVTGATGKQGGAVARHLLGAGYRIKAMTRKPDSDKAGALRAAGAEIVYGDYDDAQSLVRALKGVTGVFAVQNTWEAGVEREEEQGKRFAEIAREYGVTQYVYTSVASAQRHTGIPHFENKWRIEEKVRSLQFPFHAIVRPVFFMENFLSPEMLPGILQGKLQVGVKPETKLQMIAVDDIGRIALILFDHPDTLNRAELDIAGDVHTMPEVASSLGLVLGTTVKFQSVPKEDVRKFSEDYAIMLEWFDRIGYNVQINELEATFGIRLVMFEEWAKKVDWKMSRAA